jgi:hypothetical protein
MSRLSERQVRGIFQLTFKSLETSAFQHDSAQKIKRSKGKPIHENAMSVAK